MAAEVNDAKTVTSHPTLTELLQSLFTLSHSVQPQTSARKDLGSLVAGNVCVCSVPKRQTKSVFHQFDSSDFPTWRKRLDAEK